MRQKSSTSNGIEHGGDVAVSGYIRRMYEPDSNWFSRAERNGCRRTWTIRRKRHLQTTDTDDEEEEKKEPPKKKAKTAAAAIGQGKKRKAKDDTDEEAEEGEEDTAMDTESYEEVDAPIVPREKSKRRQASAKVDYKEAADEVLEEEERPKKKAKKSKKKSNSDDDDDDYTSE